MPALLLPIIAGLLLAGLGVALVAGGDGLVAAKSGRLPKSGLPERMKKLPERAEKTKLVPRPAAIPGATAPTRAKGFIERRRASVLRVRGCKEWHWGFCVDEITDSATRAQGAGVVADIMGWIGDYTGLSVITGALCFRFSFKLWSFDDPEQEAMLYGVLMQPLSMEDKYGAELVDEIARQHPVKSVKSDERRVVIEPSVWHKLPAYTVYFVDERVWMILATTSDIRKALRSDYIRPYQVAKAQCADGRWSLTTRTKALNVFT